MTDKHLLDQRVSDLRTYMDNQSDLTSFMTNNALRILTDALKLNGHGLIAAERAVTEQARLAAACPQYDRLLQRVLSAVRGDGTTASSENPGYAANTPPKKSVSAPVRSDAGLSRSRSIFGAPGAPAGGGRGPNI